MKKIALCSLVLGLSFVSCGFAETNNTNLDKVCRQYLKGGTAELGKCDQPTKPEGAPDDWAITPELEGINNFINKPCNSAPSGTEGNNHRCFLNKISTNPEKYQVSCAAKVCDKDHLLWFAGKNNPQSQGLCFARSWLQSYCDKGCGCDETQKCVLNEMTKTAPGWNIPTQAFVGEEACHCVPKTNTDPGEFCEYTFEADVHCFNGKDEKFTRELKIPKSVFKDGNCPEKAGYPNFETWYNQQEASVKQWADKNCAQQPNGNTTITTIDDQKLKTATGELDKFFAIAESHKSGWKTADGKFNTTRLASDISAGVVLGTVGGVVSGVVIKKKQVEKGFDALHCTVGGQKVANWGDEFSVGLQK